MAAVTIAGTQDYRYRIFEQVDSPAQPDLEPVVSRRRPPRLQGRPPPARERGIVVFVALIAVVLLSLAAVGMMRSLHSSTLVVGNLAFRQAASRSSTAAVETAVYDMFVPTATIADLTNHDLNRNYYATIQPGEDALGVPAALQSVGAYPGTFQVLTDSAVGQRPPATSSSACAFRRPSGKAAEGVECEMIPPKQKPGRHGERSSSTSRFDPDALLPADGPRRRTEQFSHVRPGDAALTTSTTKVRTHEQPLFRDPWRRAVAALLAFLIGLGPLGIARATRRSPMLADEPMAFVPEGTAEHRPVRRRFDVACCRTSCPTTSSAACRTAARPGILPRRERRDEPRPADSPARIDTPEHIYHQANFPFPTYADGVPQRRRVHRELRSHGSRSWPAPVHSNALNRDLLRSVDHLSAAAGFHRRFAADEKRCSRRPCRRTRGRPTCRPSSST